MTGYSANEIITGIFNVVLVMISDATSYIDRKNIRLSMLVSS
jgi:hypothetical protein